MSTRISGLWLPLVTPFKEQLGEFRQRVDHIHAADARDRGQLQEQVAQLARLNQAVSQQAQALTNALTISSKSMGDWGEVVLRRILEDSELRAEKEYFLQKMHERLPATRVQKIINTMKRERGGKLQHESYQARMTGRTEQWDVTKRLFEFHIKRLGFNQDKGVKQTDETPTAAEPSQQALF